MTARRDGDARWRAVLAGLLLPALLLPQALAQSPSERAAAAQGEPRRQVRIEIASVILAEPASDTALPIEIGPIEAVPRNSLLRVRGMPVKAALSEGHAVGPGAWAVPIGAVPRLRVLLPVGLAGKSEVTIALVTIDGQVVAETRFALLIGSAGLIAPDTAKEKAPSGEPPVAGARPSAKAAAAVAPSPADPPPAAAPPPVPPATAPPPRSAAPSGPAPDTARSQAPRSAPPPPSPEAEARARAFLARGEALRKDGDIVSARLFFERAADMGLADGALALGGTFDPHELARQKVHGLKPDPAEARRWYEKARGLGSSQAEERLARLGG